MQEKTTKNLEAYDLYLQAKESIVDAEFSWENEREKLLNAIKLLGVATRMDWKFALAYCLIARAHDDLYDWEFDKSQERDAPSAIWPPHPRRRWERRCSPGSTTRGSSLSRRSIAHPASSTFPI